MSPSCCATFVVRAWRGEKQERWRRCRNLQGFSLIHQLRAAPAAFYRCLIKANELWVFFSLPSFRQRATCSFSLRFWAAGMALMVFSPPGISWELKPGLSSAARYTWLPVFHQDSFVLGNNAPSLQRFCCAPSSGMRWLGRRFTSALLGEKQQEWCVSPRFCMGLRKSVLKEKLNSFRCSPIWAERSF